MKNPKSTEQSGVQYTQNEQTSCKPGQALAEKDQTYSNPQGFSQDCKNEDKLELNSSSSGNQHNPSPAVSKQMLYDEQVNFQLDQAELHKEGQHHLNNARPMHNSSRLLDHSASRAQNTPVSNDRGQYDENVAINGQTQQDIEMTAQGGPQQLKAKPSVQNIKSSQKSQNNIKINAQPRRSSRQQAKRSKSPVDLDRQAQSIDSEKLANSSQRQASLSKNNKSKSNKSLSKSKSKSKNQSKGLRNSKQQPTEKVQSQKGQASNLTNDNKGQAKDSHLLTPAQHHKLTDLQDSAVDNKRQRTDAKQNNKSKGTRVQSESRGRRREMRSLKSQKQADLANKSAHNKSNPSTKPFTGPNKIQSSKTPNQHRCSSELKQDNEETDNQSFVDPTPVRSNRVNSNSNASMKKGSRSQSKNSKSCNRKQTKHALKVHTRQFMPEETPMDTLHNQNTTCKSKMEVGVGQAGNQQMISEFDVRMEADSNQQKEGEVDAGDNLLENKQTAGMSNQHCQQQSSRPAKAAQQQNSKMMKHNNSPLQRQQNDNNFQMSRGLAQHSLINPHDSRFHQVLPYGVLADRTASKYDFSEAIIQKNMDQSIICQPPQQDSTHQMNSFQNGSEQHNPEEMMGGSKNRGQQVKVFNCNESPDQNEGQPAFENNQAQPSQNDKSPAAESKKESQTLRMLPKRRARAQRNSKYDDSNYIVDYSGSGNQTKYLLQQHNPLRVGIESSEQLDQFIESSEMGTKPLKRSKRVSKHSAKMTYKQSRSKAVNEVQYSQMMQRAKGWDLLNLQQHHEIMDEVNIFQKIKSIKIEKDDLAQMAKNTDGPEANEEGFGEQLYQNQKSLYPNDGIATNDVSKLKYKTNQFSQLHSTTSSKLPITQTAKSSCKVNDSNGSHFGILTSENVSKDKQATSLLGKSDIFRIPTSINEFNYSETQKKLIRHQELNPHLYKRGPTKYQTSQNAHGINQRAKGHWTEQEDKKLTDAVKANGGKNWKKIAEALQGRTDVQCLHRWQKVLNPSLVKGPWTDIEDRLLLHLVNIDGPQKWTAIASHLPGRIGKQCRERWHNHLNPMIKRNIPWSMEEEWILFLLNRDDGNKWADIANMLEGRTDNTIKNHWNSSMKKRIKEYQDEFIEMLKERLRSRRMNFIGCDPVEVDENGDPVNQGRTIKYPDEYVRIMKGLEQDLLDDKIQAVRDQNRHHYVTKCKDLIAQSENDSFSRAAAYLMLSSGCQYLEELRIQYIDQMRSNDLNIMGDPYSTNQNQHVQASEVFHNNQTFDNSKFKNQEDHEDFDNHQNYRDDSDSESQQDQKRVESIYEEQRGPVETQITPDRSQNINVYEQMDQFQSTSLDKHPSFRIRGLETSGMTYDKENIQINQPRKSKRRDHSKVGKETETQIQQFREDHPLQRKSIDLTDSRSLMKKSNILREKSLNNPSGAQKQVIQVQRGSVFEQFVPASTKLTFHEKLQLKAQNSLTKQNKGSMVGQKNLGASNMMDRLSSSNLQRFNSILSHSKFNPSDQNFSQSNKKFQIRDFQGQFNKSSFEHIRNYQTQMLNLQLEESAKRKELELQQQAFSEQCEVKQSQASSNSGIHQDSNSNEKVKTAAKPTVSKDFKQSQFSILSNPFKSGFNKSPNIDGYPLFSADKLNMSSSSAKNNKKSKNFPRPKVQQWPLQNSGSNPNHIMQKTLNPAGGCANNSGRVNDFYGSYFQMNKSPFLSANSSKIGASIFNQSSKQQESEPSNKNNQIQPEKKTDSSQNKAQACGFNSMSTPQVKNKQGLNINCFSLVGGMGQGMHGLLGPNACQAMASNRFFKGPQPKPNYSGEKSEGNQFARSSESLKGFVDGGAKVAAKKGNANIYEVLESPPKDERQSEDPECENQGSAGAPQSFADLCANTILSHQMVGMHGQHHPQNSHLMAQHKMHGFNTNSQQFKGNYSNQHMQSPFYPGMYGSSAHYHGHHQQSPGGFMAHPHMRCCHQFQPPPCCHHHIPPHECQMIPCCSNLAMMMGFHPMNPHYHHHPDMNSIQREHEQQLDSNGRMEEVEGNMEQMVDNSERSGEESGEEDSSETNQQMNEE